MMFNVLGIAKFVIVIILLGSGWVPCSEINALGSAGVAEQMIVCWV